MVKFLLPNTPDILFKNISLNINTSQSTNNLHLNIIPYNLSVNLQFIKL